MWLDCLSFAAAYEGAHEETIPGACAAIASSAEVLTLAEIAVLAWWETESNAARCLTTALTTLAGLIALLTCPLAIHQAPHLAVDAAGAAGTAVAASVWQSAAAQAGLRWVTAWQGQR